MAMSIDDLQSNILKGLGGAFLGVFGFVCWVVIHSPTREDVKEMIGEALRHPDKQIIDLYTLDAKAVVEREKIRDNMHVQNEKLWDEIGRLRLEIEKLNLKSELEEKLEDVDPDDPDSKKKSKAQPEPQSRPAGLLAPF